MMSVNGISRCVLAVSLLLAALLCLCSAKNNYAGYQLLTVKFADHQQRRFLDQLTNELQLDVWLEGSEGWDVLVPPTRLTSVKQQLVRHGLTFKITFQDMQREIDVEESRLVAARLSRTISGRDDYDYNDFNTLEDIQAELDEVVARCPAGLTCETVVHGVSYQGRDIRGVRIYREGAAQKKIWIDATIHAREWLATATCMKIITHIVDDYAAGTAAHRALVEEYDWYLLPVLNVDGYTYTWSDDRLWRKNRTPNDGSICFGTDLNRNFADGQWGGSGASGQACSDTFYGAGPGSELEVQALQNALSTMSADLLLSVNLHTYGQMWLQPWSYTNPDGSCYIGLDHDAQMAVTNAAANAVEATHGTVWTRGPFCSVLYPGSGTSVDYGKGVAGVNHTFLPELRGNSFIALNTQIQPSFEEIWNGIAAAIDAIEAQ